MKPLDFISMAVLFGALLSMTHRQSGVLGSLNPYLRSATTDTCYPLDTPFSQICFGTRCAHLFNNTNGRLNPAPSNNYPQNYPGFGCNVTTWYEYGPSLPQRACLRPVCFCKKYFLGGSCYPTQFNSCDKHKCQYNQNTDTAKP